MCLIFDKNEHDMKDFSELIKTRRSIRQFTEELLDGDAVKLLLRAGQKNFRALFLENRDFFFA